MKRSLAILMVMALAFFAFGCKKEENTNVTDTAVVDTSSTMTMSDTSGTAMSRTPAGPPSQSPGDCSSREL